MFQLVAKPRRTSSETASTPDCWSKIDQEHIVFFKSREMYRDPLPLCGCCYSAINVRLPNVSRIIHLIAGTIVSALVFVAKRNA